jgi:glutaredoxin
MILALYLLRKYYKGLSLVIIYMNIPRPGGDSYTIYSKSGCLFCTKAKVLLQNERIPPLFVNCDNFLLENKEEFLNLMKSLIGYEYKTFPMIFKNGRFIGGYNKTKEFYEESKRVARGDF